MNFDRIIKKYKYISFDVFDTLINRNLSKPSDLFYFVELNFNVAHSDKISNFYEKRRLAEVNSRSKNRSGEVTIDEIYNELLHEYKKDVVDELKQLEIKLELEFCVANGDMVEFYRKCISMGKRVILISDMYLPIHVIESILKGCNITGYKKLYLSSDVKLTKTTGNMYKHVISDLNISKNQIIHIGDNKKSDFFVPLKLGMRSVLIPRYVNHLELPVLNGISDKYSFTWRTISAFINNSINQNDNIFWRRGFESMGSVLYGFIKWIIDELKMNDIKKVFFLSRDGYLMKKAFDILCDEEHIISKYMYVSRRSLTIPAIWIEPEWEYVSKCSSVIYDVETLKEFLELFDFDPNSYEQLANHYNMTLDSKIDIKKKPNAFSSFYNAIKNDICVKSKAEYNILVEYLKQIGFSGKVAIVDLSWLGSTKCILERLTEKLVETKIYGYNLGVPENRYNLSCIYGYLNIILSKSFVESLFSIPSPSVHSYVKSCDGMVKPKFFTMEFLPQEISNIEQFQSGALYFVEKIYQKNSLNLLTISREVASYRFFQLIYNPSYRDSCLFGQLRHGGYNLIEMQSRIKYILNVKMLISDLKKSGWRMGFIKKLLPLPIKYGELNLFVKNKFNYRKR